MKDFLRLVMCLVVVTVIVIGMTGCINTARGTGELISGFGEDISDLAIGYGQAAGLRSEVRANQQRVLNQVYQGNIILRKPVPSN